MSEAEGMVMGYYVIRTKEEKDKKAWIDETFEFPGGGIIQTKSGLDFTNCRNLIRLPDNLKAKGNLSIGGCMGLTRLPNELEVEGCLYLSSGLNEQVKRDAEKLDREGKIKNRTMYC